MIDLQKVRSETPGVEHCVHFNNAGASLMPSSVIEAMQQYLAFEAITGGYEAAEQRSREIDEFYEVGASFLGAEPRNIAFTASATDAFDRALSSIPFQPGDVILTSKNDYISNQLAFISLGKRFGIEVVHAEDLAEGGVDPGSVEECIRVRRPRLVSISHVPTNSGLIQDVYGVGEVCARHEVLYLVDACQSAGQMPLDARQIGCDFLSATFRKFLRGPRGAGLLYVSDNALSFGLEPLFIDMRGARWTAPDGYTQSPTAKRFEEWEQNYALLMGAKACLQYAMDIGLEVIRDRIFAMAQDLRSGLAAIPGMRVLDRGKHQCAITTSHLDGMARETLAEHLKDVNIGFSLAEYAVIDFGEKQVPWALRASPHYFNTNEELDTLVGCVESAARA